MRGPLKTGAGVFPEEDLRDELVTNGKPLVMKLADVLDRFDVKPSDRAAVAEIEEWFEELGMAAEPTLLETEGRKRKLTLYMREWGPPANGASPEPVAVERPSDEGPGLAAQLAAETGMPLAAAADVIGQFDPGSDFVAGLRERASEAAPEPAEPAVEPADSVPEPAPAAESEDAEQPARPRRRRTLLVASWVMFVAGGLLLLEAGITVVWQEPFSAFYSARAQGRLEDKLERLEDSERARENAQKRRLLAAEKRAERPGKRRISRKRKSEARITSLADSFSRRVGEGKPLGEISIPRMGMKQVMVQGTKPTTLRQGPGHYTGTTLPGQDGTVGIAGHRSTYSAPFKKLNELKKGDEVFVKLPYGLFTYRIEGTKIISPDNIGAFRRAGYNRLMMTACHPIFSDRQRIIAFGRLEKIEPRGAAVL